MKKTSHHAPIVIGLVTLGLFLSGIFFVAPKDAYACAGTGVVKSSKPSYNIGDDLDATVFFGSDGSCGSNKIKINLRYAVGGQAYDVYATECPSANQNDNYCVVNGNNYQLHVSQKSYFTVPGSGNFEAEIFVDNALLQKTPPLTVSVAGTTNGPPQTESNQPKPIETKLTIAINGLTQTSNLALYLSTLYTYGLQIVGTLAIFMIILGGIKYLTAGGDMSRTKSAIENITNATIGLVLALASYLILNTVNPDLLKFKPLVIDTVQRQTITLENFCEDILSHDAANVERVEPVSGRCNSKGTLIAKPGGKLVKTDCVFNTCSAGLACSKDPKGAYACGKCEDFTKERLQKEFGAGGLAGPSDADCTSRGPFRNDTAEYRACVYTNETGYGDKGCRTLAVDCKNIKTCEDYTTYVSMSEKGSGTFGAAYERNCGADTTVGGVCFAGIADALLGTNAVTPAGHLSQVCTANPCLKNIGHACEAKINKDLSAYVKTFGSGVAFFGATLEYCCTPGSTCAPPAPVQPTTDVNYPVPD